MIFRWRLAFRGDSQKKPRWMWFFELRFNYYWFPTVGSYQWWMGPEVRPQCYVPGGVEFESCVNIISAEHNNKKKRNGRLRFFHVVFSFDTQVDWEGIVWQFGFPVWGNHDYFDFDMISGVTAQLVGCNFMVWETGVRFRVAHFVFSLLLSPFPPPLWAYTSTGVAFVREL